ncbi:hypothetical protein KN1_00420 [Stygiolobus caldivivus]|uniref:Uncharacterized protein n=1 Tax=Stygiolobus caldivivus TaxID=2824673 RepID=A0A8D5ZHN3_9CREN|nr:hypothetical protein KN1_00420 [Stygiolobus caldivivus]
MYVSSIFILLIKKDHLINLYGGDDTIKRSLIYEKIKTGIKIKN